MSSEHVKILPVKPVIQHVASGSQRAFSFPFAIFSAEDIEVLINTTKQSGNYTVSGLRVSTGGTVTFTTAPAAGATVTLRRRLALQRTSDFMPYDKFRASVINDELDYLAAGLQQLAADIDGCVRVAPEEVGTPAALDLPPRATRANKWLGFDAAGEVIAGQPQAQQPNQASWGAITGSLSAQTDLQTALNQKASTTHSHSGVYAPATHNHDASYVPIIASPASGKFPTMTATGALQTSTYGPSSFAGASHTHTASQLSLGGSLVDASGTLQLAADAAAPGSSRYYGTDGSGVKGFFPLPAGGTITVKDEGSPVATNVSALNFTGGAVSASASGGEVTVNVAAAGATNAFGTVKVGSTNVEADAVSDTLTFSAGAGMGISANATTDTVTFSVSFAGTGSAANVARSDHNHDTAYAAVAHNHDAAYAAASHTHTAASLTDRGDFYAKTRGAGLTDSAGTVAVASALDSTARVAVKRNGTTIGTRRGINLIQGSNVTLTVADDAANEEVDVTIAATGTGGATQAFGTVAVAGQDSVVADAAPDVLTLSAGAGIAITTDAANDGVQFAVAFAGNGAAASAARSDHTHDGAYLPATTYTFGTVKVGSTNVEADAVSDTLTFSAGAGMGISANATTDTVTFSVSFAGTGSAANVARSDHNHDTAYAAVAHNHDAAYAAASHTHTAAQLSLGGSLTNASGALQLAGDATAPGVSRYYGTDGSGAKGFFALPAGGGSGSPGGSDTQIQFNASGAFAGSASLTYATTLKLLKTPLLGGKIFDAGTISGTWSPPLAQGASVVLAAAAGNFTLATPSGVSLPNDHEVYLHLVINNTAASPIYVTFDVGDGAGQYKVLHKRPLNTILPGASIELFVRWLGTRWFLVGPQPSPYPITFQVSGVPDASSVLFGMYVHNLGQPGALYVPYRLDDVGNVTCGTAPTASTAFSIERSASGQQPWAQIGTVTFNANTKDWSTWSFPNGIVRFDHGDRLRIVAPANLNGLADLTFIMECLS